jgi:hypothetical protein
MPANSSPPGSIVRMTRLNLHCLVPREHPFPGVVCGQLRSIAEGSLRDVCTRQLAPLCPDNDPSIWFIRRLDIQAAVNANWERDRVAEALSAPLERALHRKLGDGSDGTEVLHFRDRAAYLAQFLCDLADGVAWSKWYYVGFDGLRALPISAALRETLMREPTTGEAALVQMVGSGRVDKVLRALNGADCRTVLTAFCGASTSALEQRSRALIDGVASAHRDALRLYLTVRHEAPTVQPTLALLEAVLHSSLHADGTVATETRTDPLFTPFGGLFHLLPHLMEIDLDKCVAALPTFAEAPPISLVRFLVLLKCLGRERAARAFFDPLLRKIAGVAPDINAHEIRAWARELTPEMTRDFQVRWAASCQTSGTTNARWLCIRLAHRGRLLFIADGERNCWLRIVRSIDELSEALQTIYESVTDGEYGPLIFCDPTLVSVLPATVAGVPVLAWNSSEAMEYAAEDSALATCLARAHPPDEDLNYLNLTSLLRGALDCDLALSLIANAILRSFAWRLPGFAWSSAEYLYRNFSDAEATLRADEDRWIVSLRRPPLHIVLTMTGADQDVYQISWLNQRKVCLTTAES